MGYRLSSWRLSTSGRGSGPRRPSTAWSRQSLFSRSRYPQLLRLVQTFGRPSLLKAGTSFFSVKIQTHPLAVTICTKITFLGNLASHTKHRIFLASFSKVQFGHVFIMLLPFIEIALWRQKISQQFLILCQCAPTDAASLYIMYITYLVSLCTC